LLEVPVIVTSDAEMAAKVREELNPESKIAVDSQSCSSYTYSLYKEVVGADNIRTDLKSIVSSQKVIKNKTEISNLRKALLTESCALVSTYAQIKAKIREGTFYEH
jgi:Xaa-Pro aminopeptidase